MPSKILATTIHSQRGAAMTMNGTGRPISQPATSSGLRPTRSALRPANRFANALTMPKLMMNERVTLIDVRPKS
jgi:hypothetical protein